jgi:uncharacterized protein (TIGR02246 family)
MAGTAESEGNTMKIRATIAVLLLAVPATLHAAPQAPTLEQRVQHIEDTLAIEHVINEYAALLDARDIDGYAALFAKDGIWQTGKSVHQGAAAIKSLLTGIFGTPPPGFVNIEDFHLVSNVEIKLVDRDHATAHSRYLYVVRDKDGHPRPALAGRYEDEFVRENGQWKILHRTDYPVIPTAEEWLKEVTAQQ